MTPEPIPVKPIDTHDITAGVPLAAEGFSEVKPPTCICRVTRTGHVNKYGPMKLTFPNRQCPVHYGQEPQDPIADVKAYIDSIPHLRDQPLIVSRSEMKRQAIMRGEDQP